MAFIETRFPTTISWGSSGGPSHDTALVEVRSGQETRTSRREVARMVFNAHEAVKNPSEIAELITFIRVTRGSALGFRFFDHTDHSTGPNHTGMPTELDCLIGIGDGVSTQFQLVKTYSRAGITRTRPITKPIHNESVEVGEGTFVTFDVLIAFDGIDQPSGWTVDTTTGIVTFTTPPADGVEISAGCAFDVPARFGEEADRLLDIAIHAREDMEISDVPIIEIVHEGFVDEERYYGGAKDHGPIGDNVSISLLGGFLQTMTPLVGGLKCLLPDFTDIPTGKDHFALANEGTFDLDVRDHLNNSVATLAQGTMATIHLSVDGSGTKVWLAL